MVTHKLFGVWPSYTTSKGLRLKADHSEAFGLWEVSLYVLIHAIFLSKSPVPAILSSVESFNKICICAGVPT